METDGEQNQQGAPANGSPPSATSSRPSAMNSMSLYERQAVQVGGMCVCLWLCSPLLWLQEAHVLPVLTVKTLPTTAVGACASVLAARWFMWEEASGTRHWLVLSWWSLCHFHTTRSQVWAICLSHPVASIPPAALLLPLHATLLVHQAAGRRFWCCSLFFYTFFTLLWICRRYASPLFYFPPSLRNTVFIFLGLDVCPEFCHLATKWCCLALLSYLFLYFYSSNN